MVNDKDTAILISDLMLRFGKELDESVAVVQSRCDENEFKAYREAVGFIMGEMLIKIMNPLYEKHPEIKPKRIEIKHLESDE
ncbi:putative cytoplasmic protein [Salmonella enterica subsp. enterica]|nr:putative cytoplasmic protein [Salmonella enterica subsp. enterica]